MGLFPTVFSITVKSVASMIAFQELVTSTSGKEGGHAMQPSKDTLIQFGLEFPGYKLQDPTNQYFISYVSRRKRLCPIDFNLTHCRGEAPT
jgi:hypothetical protein